MKIDSFVTPAFFDAHVHLRQGNALPEFLAEHARHSDYLLAMPNTDPALEDRVKVNWYRNSLNEAATRASPLVLLAYAISLEQDAEEVEEMTKFGVVAGKMYPRGLTTNSSHGVEWKDVSVANPKMRRTLEVLSQLDLVLCVHAETHHGEVKDFVSTETSWLPFLKSVHQQFPKLRMVVEHVTSRGVAEWVAEATDPDFVACTVTPQHLLWSVGDLFDGGLRPLRYCKPVYKDRRDLEFIRACVFHKKNFFLGSDSAPHLKEKKFADFCCAGVYSAPVLPEVLAEFFEKFGALDPSFSAFSSRRACEFYRLKSTPGKLRFRREDWKTSRVSPYVTAWDDHPFGWRAERVEEKK